MKKRIFILLELIIPLIFFISWMGWNLLIKNYPFVEAFTISTGVTFIVVILMNLFIALNYTKYSIK